MVGAGIVVVAYGLIGNRGVFRDSGITACQSIRDHASASASSTPSGNASSAKDPAMTEAQYRATRMQFADSRYGDLRDAGTRFVDLVWQLSRMGGDASAALVLVGPLYEAYASLVGACENHGIGLPAMGASGAH